MSIIVTTLTIEIGIIVTTVMTGHWERGIGGLVYLPRYARPHSQNLPHAPYIGGQAYWRSGDYIGGLGGL